MKSLGTSLLLSGIAVTIVAVAIVNSESTEKTTETPETTQVVVQPTAPATLPAEPVTLPPTTPAPTTTLPDLSGVDFVALGRALYGKCGEYYQMAMSIGWPEEEWKTLSQVMWRESRCQTDAWNGHDAGLMQINQIHTEWAAQMGFTHPEDLFTPENNLLFALRLWETSGWRPWRFSGPIPE